MSDLDIQILENSYALYDEREYEMYLESCFHDFSEEMKQNSMLPKTYDLPSSSDVRAVHSFWEVV